MLCSPPRIQCDSAQADSCTIFMDVANSKTGTCSKRLVGKSLSIDGKHCPINAATLRTGTPVCQNCWTWGHPTFACKSRLARCPICTGPHEKANHCQFAGCCHPKDKTKWTPADQPCPPPSRCVNCGKDHAADSAKCAFWAHRFDAEWIQKEYSKVRASRFSRRATNGAPPASTL